MTYSNLNACIFGLLFSSSAIAQPNILLIFSDDLNTRIGPYMEIDEHTPYLDKLASKGVIFNRAYCQYPLSGPSRASIMSGLYPETNGVLGNNSKPGSYKKVNSNLKNHPSMAGFFREQGYFTARVSKIFHMGVPGGIERGEPGGDEPDSWDYTYNVMGPETLSPGNLELLSPKNLHYGSNFSRLILPDSLRFFQTDYLATNQAIAILESRAKGTPSEGKNAQKLKPNSPFFLAVGFVRPHVPLIAPEDCFSQYPEENMTIPPYRIRNNVPAEALRQRNGNIFGMDDLQKKKVISSYMASVRFMDEQVGRLLDALDRLELRDNTIIIFLSDHGFNLGEHDSWAKTSLWEGVARAPLIISAPGMTETHGKSCNSIVQFIDLYPTLTDLCNMSKKQPSNLQGSSLVPLLKNPELQKKDAVAYTITYKGAGRTIRTSEWRYTQWIDSAGQLNEELYNHITDPEEWQNCLGIKGYEETIKALRSKMQSMKQIAKP